jgi:hypothetical protein
MLAAWARRVIAIGVTVSVPLVGACSVYSGPPSYGGSGSGPAYPGPTSGGTSGGGSSSGGTASTQPMLVDVDPNRTMNAQPGEGVGVFTEYVSGGHWHVWWTCDTNQTGFDCSFDVTVSVAGGAIDNGRGEALAATDQILQSSACKLEVVTQTSTAINGVTFDAPPGAAITLDAKMNGQDDGAILFFVQLATDGTPQVNGGYHGPLTDPLMLEPSSP